MISGHYLMLFGQNFTMVMGNTSLILVNIFICVDVS